jgi:PadR family transcriptional regulator PadR
MATFHNAGGTTSTLILAVLATGPLHGYAIAREVERRSADALSMGEGILYPSLRNLEEDGLIVGSWQPQPSGPARKIYALTEDGRQEMLKRVQAWEKQTAAIRSVLGRTLHEQSA